MLGSVLLITSLHPHALRIPQIIWGNADTAQKEFPTQGTNQQMDYCRFPVVCTNAPYAAKSLDWCYLAGPTSVFLTFCTVFLLTVLFLRNLFHFHFTWFSFSLLLLNFSFANIWWNGLFINVEFTDYPLRIGSSYIQGIQSSDSWWRPRWSSTVPSVIT